MSKVRKIDIKNRTYYFLMTESTSKILIQTTSKLFKKLYKNILIYYIGYVTPTSLSLCTF